MSMRLSTLGNGLVIAGGAVGVATVTAIATGTEIVLTPAMVQLLIFKGLAAAAVGLIVVGAWLGRRGRQHDQAAIGAAPDTPELEAEVLHFIKAFPNRPTRPPIGSEAPGH